MISEIKYKTVPLQKVTKYEVKALKESRWLRILVLSHEKNI